MKNKQTIISLDPIDRQKELGFFGRILRTRYSGGRKTAKQEKYGHYMFCGKQRSGKSVSAIWFAEKLNKRYKHRKLVNYSVMNNKGNLVKFNTPPKVRLYSNMDIGTKVNRSTLFKTINEFDSNANEIRIVIIDEIQAYFPKETRDKETRKLMEDLIAIFCQLGKRNTYILSTSQVYGRVDKSLREQCLYMINCTKTINNKIRNEFIPGDDILVDQLGRWAGKPEVIYVHGLQKLTYDTKLVITE